MSNLCGLRLKPEIIERISIKLEAGILWGFVLKARVCYNVTYCNLDQYNQLSM